MKTKVMKIIIIEDDINDCNNFMNCVKNRKDIEIVGITDSDVEGLQYVKSKRPDGIILDLELNNSLSGNTDSLGFLTELKKLNLGYDPIIVVTTHIHSKRIYDIVHRNGADIIVNTDADNQYCGADIEKLVQPILRGEAGMVVGERPIDQTEHFSPIKKKLQHLGSWVVRKASKTDIPDAPSGFRAYSRSTAMRMNVINEYTYTLETIVQAGRNKMAITSVPIRTNPELRKSRLFHSMFGYVKKSMLTIARAFMMYKPLAFFSAFAAVFGITGVAIGIRYLYFMANGQGSGHIPSLILASMLIIIGVLAGVIACLGDVIAANRKLLQEIQYELRRMEYGKGHEAMKREKTEERNEKEEVIYYEEHSEIA